VAWQELTLDRASRVPAVRTANIGAFRGGRTSACLGCLPACRRYLRRRRARGFLARPGNSAFEILGCEGEYRRGCRTGVDGGRGNHAVVVDIDRSAVITGLKGVASGDCSPVADGVHGL